MEHSENLAQAIQLRIPLNPPLRMRAAHQRRVDLLTGQPSALDPSPR